MNTPDHQAARLSPGYPTPSSAISSYGNDLDEDFNTINRIEERLGAEVDHLAVLAAYNAVKSTLQADKHPTTSLLVSELRRMGGYSSVSPFSFSPLPDAPAWNGKLILDDDNGNDVDISNQDQNISRKSLSKPVIPALKLMKSLSLSVAEASVPEPQSLLSSHSIWSLLSVIFPDQNKRRQPSHTAPQSKNAKAKNAETEGLGLLSSHPIDLWDEEEERGEEEEEKERLPMLPDAWWCVLDLISSQTESSMPNRLTFGQQIAHTHYSTVFMGCLKAGWADQQEQSVEQSVVIKKMDLSENSSKANIVAELVALRQLNCSQASVAVKLLDFCVTDNGKTALIVLQKFQGNLRAWSQSEQRSIEEKMMAFGRICHLVSSLHQANIAHCDLKLDNLLINNDDVSSIVLCDFSECCSIPISSDTLLSHSRGTECYASPELHKSTPTRPYSVDCWCLGCLFYELVTGRILFPGKGDCLLPSLASEDWPAHGSGVASIFESHFKSNQAASMALSLLQSILKKEETRLDSIEIARRVDRIISHS